MTEAERKEMEELRARVAELEERLAHKEMAEADRDNPNVFILEGELGYYGDNGPWCATSVKTRDGIEVYLVEAIRQMQAITGQVVSASWHISSEPKLYSELEGNMVKTAMGALQTEFHHAHSDLTGYLWTEESITVGGHDILEEISQVAKNFNDGKRYLVIRIERTD